MPPTTVALCTYSHGLGNGIAHMDSALAEGLDPALFRCTVYVLRADFPAGKRECSGRYCHVSLADAYPFLRDAFRDVDIVQVNGALDPVAANAAAAAGVPAIVEVMHQVETGGLHPSLDRVICVSELVRSVQTHGECRVIHNGVDTGQFSFLPGRRDAEKVILAQVANASSPLHFELGDIVAGLNDPRVAALTAGGRPESHGLPALGVVADMPALFHQTDLAVLFGKQHAFGLVLAEAMACGALPVITGDSGAASFIEHGKTGWVVERPERTLAIDVLRRAVDTVARPEFIRMQRAARAVIVENFSRERMIRDYQQLYAACGKRPRQPEREPAVWMDLALFAVLNRQGREEALAALDRFTSLEAPLEPYFLRHPLGAATIAAALGACPALAERGERRLAAGLCRRLRASRIIMPLLDDMEAAFA